MIWLARRDDNRTVSAFCTMIAFLHTGLEVIMSMK